MEVNKRDVAVVIEYCGVCDFTRQCQDLKTFLNEQVPEAKVSCNIGRRGAFEVKINETLVHSKIQQLAFPDNQDVAEQVKNSLQGKEIRQVKEKPITECLIM
ncbi:unnamed protein product [Diamesa hyperborea]